VKVAVLGVGRIGTFHARLLAERLGGASLVLVDADAARADTVARELGAATAPHMASALEAADAVLICSPPANHAEQVRAALALGRPVFCEKPLAAELAETVELVETVESTGAALQVGFQRRFDPAYAAARERLESGALGRVNLVRLTAHDPRWPREPGGDIFRDSSIHDFDLTRFLSGQEIDEVFAYGTLRPEMTPDDEIDPDVVVVAMRLSGGGLALLGGMRLNPLGYDVRSEVIGEYDGLVAGLGPRTPIRSLEPEAPPLAEDAWQTYLTRFEPAYRAELERFLALAAGDASSPCTARDALEAMRAAVAAGLSYRDRRPVRLADVA
jgi:myo-inositol 2-dehydrogenase/D-chiro-inositol 1-dehydrogenase